MVHFKSLLNFLFQENAWIQDISIKHQESRIPVNGIAQPLLDPSEQLCYELKFLLFLVSAISTLLNHFPFQPIFCDASLNHNEQARKLQATLVRNYHRPTRWRGWSVELLALGVGD